MVPVILGNQHMNRLLRVLWGYLGFRVKELRLRILIKHCPSPSGNYSLILYWEGTYWILVVVVRSCDFGLGL